MIHERDLDLKLFKLVDGSWIIAHVMGSEHSEMFYKLMWPMKLGYGLNEQSLKYVVNGMDSSSDNPVVMMTSSIMFIAAPGKFRRDDFVSYNASKIIKET